MNLPIIKSTDFDVNGTSHVNYLLSFKGRAFKASTLVFGDAIKPSPDGKTLEIPNDLGYRKSTYNKETATGLVPSIGYEFMPSLGLICE